MSQPEFRSSPQRDRHIALLELVFHVGRLVEEGRLTNPDGAAIIRLLHDHAEFERRKDDGGD